MTVGATSMGLVTMVLCVAPLAGLEPGDTAPPLAVERWVAGEPVRHVGEPGKDVFVIVFWGTWSKPSVDSLGELSAIQKSMKNSRVVVVGVSAESAETVQDFVRKELASRDLSIRLAVDDDHRTTNAYMRAAGQHALPHVFVVDTAGVMAWHGHPNDARAVVEQVAKGEFKVNRRAQRPTGAVTEIDEELMEQLRDAVLSQDWRQAVALIERIVRRYPDSELVPDLLGNKFMILYEQIRDDTAAEDFARDVLKQHGDKARALNNIAWALLARGSFETLDRRWPDLAHQAARKAFEVTQGEDAAILDTYARSLYLLGRVDQAREHQQTSVDLFRAEVEQARTAGASEEELAEMTANLKDLEAALSYYEDILMIRGRSR